MTQQELATRVGVTQRVIAYWERESVSLRADQLTALAAALNVTVDELLGRDSSKPRGHGPAGKLRRIFETASQLPRHQQTKVIEFMESYIRGLGTDSALASKRTAH